MSTAGTVPPSTGAPASTGAAPASTGGAPAATGAQAFSWSDGWRDALALTSTDVEKERKQLERYESPEQIWRKARELESKLSSGELRRVLPKDARPEEIARWRQENGIPAKPEEYKINMPAGRQAPKEDDAFLKAFLKSAHESNYTQAQVDQAINAFYAEVDRQETAIAEAERAAEQATEDELRRIWGADYRVNKNMAEALLARAPAGLRDKFLNGYLADHTPIRTSVDAWQWLVQMEREINPAATVLPGAGGDLGKTVGDELAALKKIMGNPNSEYWKGPNAEKNQARYRQLLEAQQKMQAKASA